MSRAVQQDSSFALWIAPSFGPASYYNWWLHIALWNQSTWHSQICWSFCCWFRIWWRRLLKKPDWSLKGFYYIKDCTAWEDNMGALTLAKLEPGKCTPRSKHYAVTKIHWFRSYYLKPSHIEIMKINRSERRADILTNGLKPETFKYIHKLLCGQEFTLGSRGCQYYNLAAICSCLYQLLVFSTMVSSNLIFNSQFPDSPFCHVVANCCPGSDHSWFW